MKPNWYDIKARENSTAEILIYEEIGMWGISAKQFAADLKALGSLKSISLRLNSPGGSVFDGASIYNLLRQIDAEVTVYVDGLAASIASVIAMAGDKVVMADNALMMIHDPWSMVIGSADEMRQEADVLDKVKESLVTTYQNRTGMNRDEIAALMADETWLDAEEAVEFGFADETYEARKEAAKVVSLHFNREDINPPEDLVERILSRGGGEETPAVHDGPVEGETTSGIGEMTMPEKTTPDLDQIKRDGAKEALAAETARRNEIAGVFAKFPEHDALMRTCQDDIECDVATAQNRLLDELGKNEEPTGRIEFGPDSSDKFRDGAAKVLVARAGLGERDPENEFGSYTLLDMARAALERNGVNTGRMTKMDMISNAFTHSTGDFGSILSNVANKSMLKGWDEAAEVFPMFTAKGNLPDFKASTRVDLGAFPSLRQVRPGAEFKHVTLSDRGETIQLATYGELFSINRQAIINDDLNLFSTVPRRFGRAAKRTIGDLVFAVITDNGAMSDGTTLFHADHSNLVSAAAPSTAALDAMRVAMAKQTDPDGNVTALNIRPKYMLTPVALEGAVKQVLESTTEIASSQSNSKRPNYVRGIAEAISDARLDASSASVYYMLTDPNMHDTIEVAYLDGIEQPFLDQMTGWTIDGSEFKVRIDAGVKALDFRGMVKNPYAG